MYILQDYYLLLLVQASKHLIRLLFLILQVHYMCKSAYLRDRVIDGDSDTGSKADRSQIIGSTTDF